jgi:hypothetical protein
MREIWCAECGAYASHDPFSFHHVVVDQPFMPRHSHAPFTLIHAMLRRSERSARPDTTESVRPGALVRLRGA